MTLDAKMLEWVRDGMPDTCCGCGHQTAMHSMMGDCTVADCHSVRAESNPTGPICWQCQKEIVEMVGLPVESLGPCFIIGDADRGRLNGAVQSVISGQHSPEYDSGLDPIVDTVEEIVESELRRRGVKS